MLRRLQIALVVTALLPASAEAAKFRFGGGKSSPSAAASSAGVVALPGLGRSARSGQAEQAETARVPFPTSSASAPPPLRLTTAEQPKSWCRSEVVVGGFCVLN